MFLCMSCERCAFAGQREGVCERCGDQGRHELMERGPTPVARQQKRRVAVEIDVRMLQQGRSVVIGPQGAVWWDQATAGPAWWLAYPNGVDVGIRRL
jgi:hypothetical protein